MDDEIHKNYLEARRKFRNGELPSYSTGMFNNELTAGYGTLNEFGYFEFPLPVPIGFEKVFNQQEYLKFLENEFNKNEKDAHNEVGVFIGEKEL